MKYTRGMMKPGQSFILTRTGEVYTVGVNGWLHNETRNKLTTLHANCHVQPITKGKESSMSRLRQAAEALVTDLQEPVAWHEPGAFGNVTTHKQWAAENGWMPLYTAPPKDEWVGLSDEELEHFRGLGFVGVLAVEAKLKEKNT